MMLFAGVVLTILGKSTIGTAVIMMDLTIKLSGAVQSIADLFPQRSLSLAIENELKPCWRRETAKTLQRNCQWKVLSV